MYPYNTGILAGAVGQPGVVDAIGSSARFNHLLSLAIDSVGNLYVTDYDSHTVRHIRRSRAEVTTLGGSAGLSGTAPGTGPAARFQKPAGFAGLAVTFDGVLMVADALNHRLGLGVMRPEPGEYYWGGLAGLPNHRSHANGARGEARLDRFGGMDVDAAGNVYVADDQASVVRKISPTGIATTVAGIPNNPDSEDSIGVENRSRLTRPFDVAVDAAGNLYLADTFNYTIRRLSPAGVMATLAGGVGQPGHVNGPGPVARFGQINGIAVGPDQNLYIADTGNHVVRKMTPAGDVSPLAGLAWSPGSANGSGTSARFREPYDVAVNAAGLCYVSDFAMKLIRTVTPGGMVSTIAGGNPPADGPGVQAGFYEPRGLAIDFGGVLYIADTIVIRRMLPSGHVGTISGNSGGVSVQAFGPGREGVFPLAAGIAVNAGGELFVSDFSMGFVSAGTPHGARLHRNGSTVNLSFGSEPFRTYFLERTPTLGAAPWTTLATPSANFSGAIQFTDTAPPGPAAFYRLRSP